MFGLDPLIAALLPGLAVLFVVTQGAYFVNNVLADLVIYRRRSEIVDGSDEPATMPTIHVLIPLYKERRGVIERTLEGIDELEYPNSLLEVHLIIENDDDLVGSYIDDLLSDFEARGLDIEYATVDRSVVASYVEDGSWDIAGEGVPRTKASALKYAFRILSLPPEDVVTVFDADTIVPPDTFDIAVAGLESYDVVQAKQTVRNLGDGWLPRLEAMGMAGWCHAIYSKTARGPYQLLGKAYFIEVSDLWAIGDWQVDAVTEDLTLGVDAYRQGYSLGIIDRYVQDICPADFSAWITQKRRWVAGPYPYVLFDDFEFSELIRFWTYSAANQMISVLNVVAVPAGVLYFVFTIAGFDLYGSVPLIVITAFNLLNWIYFSSKTYQATRAGVPFRDRMDALAFYVASNPLTQLVYSMVWAIPILLAVREYVRDGTHHTEFHVTPKQIDEIRSGASETGSVRPAVEDVRPGVSHDVGGVRSGAPDGARIERSPPARVGSKK